MTNLAPRHEAAVANRLAKAHGQALRVGVHIRHGDFKSHRGGAFHFGYDEYAVVMRRCVKVFAPRSVHFLVCTDATPDPAVFDGLDVSYPGGLPAEDLILLSRCDFIVGAAISSFALSASLLGEPPILRLTDPACPIDLDSFSPIKQLPLDPSPFTRFA